MPALYSHTTRASGTVLTATIYNGDHQNHINNGVPAQHDDYSVNVSQMQTISDPGEVGSESLATSTAGEFERLRFAIKEIKGSNQWYETPLATLNGLQQPSFRNMFENAGFLVTQLAVFATTQTANLSYLADRWYLNDPGGIRINGVSAVTTLAANGAFAKLVSTVTTTGVAGATDIFGFGHHLENIITAPLLYGTASARSSTLSFTARSSVAGTYAFSIRNAAANRSYVQTFTLSANTTTPFTFVIPGDTGGTWVGWVNQSGYSAQFDINAGCGATLQTSTLGSWQAGNFAGATGQTQFQNSGNGNTFEITCPQWEVGVGTPFEFIPYQIELARCKYHLVPLINGNNKVCPFMGLTQTTTTSYFPCSLNMRVQPTVIYANNVTIFQSGATSAAASAATLSFGTPDQFVVQITHAALTAGVPVYAQGTNSTGQLYLDARM